MAIALLAAGATFAPLSVARAEESSATIAVMRARGSEACPDASALFSTIAALFPTHPLRQAPSVESATDHVFVSIRPSGNGHAAELAVFGKHRVSRRIVDDDPYCRGLPVALAVALVMLHGTPLRLSSPTFGETRRALVLSPHFGLLSGFGVLGRPAPGVYLGLGVGRARGFAVVGRALRAVSLPTSRDGGEVQVDLWAGTFGACWRLPSPDGWSITPCAEFGAGAQHGEADGFRTDSSATRLWMVAGPSLTGGLLWTDGLEVELTGSVNAAILPARWVVSGLGTVQRQSALGAFLGIALAYHVCVR